MPAKRLYLRGFAYCLAAFVSLSSPSMASTQMTPSIEAAASLKPGQFIWDDSDADRQEPVSILVSIGAQHIYVYRGERLVGVSTVSTGKPGYDTPTGSFTILQKKEMHKSNLYDDAPMPFMQRLTWDGIAIHAGAIPGEPASHGCVRVPKAFAKKLFAITELGATVSITDEGVLPGSGEVIAIASAQ